MNRKKEPYDRFSVGDRIQKRRLSLGISQEDLAEQMDRAAKYCSDIERGSCGMSIETMLAFSKYLDMSLDYMMYGIGAEELKSDTTIHLPEVAGQAPQTVQLENLEIKKLMERCSDQEYSYALRLMEVFVDAMKGEENKE